MPIVYTGSAVYNRTLGNPDATSLATALDRTQERLDMEKTRNDILEADLNATMQQLQLAKEHERDLLRHEDQLELSSARARASMSQSRVLSETAQDTSKKLAKDLSEVQAQLERSSRSFYATQQQLELTKVRNVWLEEGLLDCVV